MPLTTLTRSVADTSDCEEALYKRRYSFELGATLTSADEVLLWESDGNFYQWTGSLPKVVAAGTVPDGAWTNVGDGRATAAFSFTQDGATTPRTVVSKLTDTISVLDYATAAEVAVSAGPAIAAALAVSTRVYFPRGAYRITVNLTVPAGTVFELDGGAVFSVDSGVTLTCKAVVLAPLAQIFTGAGSVLGISTVYPEWFGAVGDGATDDLAAINKMQACLQAATGQGKAVALFRAVNYAVSAGIICIGNTGNRWEWLGAGSTNGTILSGLSASWSNSNGAAVLFVGTAGDASVLAAFQIKGIRVRATIAGTGPTTGVLVGNSSSGTMSGGLHAASGFEDVYVEDFAIGWDILHVRLLTFDRCSAWVNTVASGIGFRIRAALAGFFTGDIEFQNCMFVVNSPATGGMPLSILAQASLATVAGVRFMHPVMYGGNCNMISTLGGRILDVWFTPGWQYDVVRESAFVLGAVGSGSLISDIHWNDGYCFGLSGRSTAYPLWSMYVLTSGAIDSIWITGNILASTVGDVIAGNGISNVFVRENVLRAPAGGNLANFNASKALVIKDNQVAIGYGGTLAHMATFTGTCDYITCTGNVGNQLTTGIADTSTGTNKVIGNNWN